MTLILSDERGIGEGTKDSVYRRAWVFTTLDGRELAALDSYGDHHAVYSAALDEFLHGGLA